MNLPSCFKQVKMKSNHLPYCLEHIQLQQNIASHNLILDSRTAVVSWSQPEAKHPHSPLPQSGRGQNKNNKGEKTHRLKKRQGNHSPCTITGKTDLENLIDLISDLGIGKQRQQTFKHLEKKPFLPLSQAWLHYRHPLSSPLAHVLHVTATGYTQSLW